MMLQAYRESCVEMEMRCRKFRAIFSLITTITFHRKKYHHYSNHPFSIIMFQHKIVPMIAPYVLDIIITCIWYEWIIRAVSNSSSARELSANGTHHFGCRFLYPCLLLHVTHPTSSYQGAYRNKDRSLVLELLLAVLSAGLIGVGIFLLGLSVGIYMWSFMA